MINKDTKSPEKPVTEYNFDEDIKKYKNYVKSMEYN